MATSLRSTFTNLESLTPGTCEYCGKDVDSDNTFCSLSCEALNRRLESAQGLLVIRALKKWRKNPNHAARNAATSEVSGIVDRFVKSDRKRRETMNEERRKAVADEAKTAQMAEFRKHADAQAKAAEKRTKNERKVAS